MIEFEGVTKQYEQSLALDGLTLTIPDNGLFVLVGPSGSGKTTTVKMINRLIEPTSGTIKIDGQPINQMDLQTLRLNIGYVLQNIALFPHLTIEENITIQLEVLKWTKADRQKRARELLEMVHLDPDQYASRYPSELSGGQQQRIGIIRALATSPKVILMDEPFSALDPVTRTQLQDLVLSLQKQLHNTIVFVTHDMKEALRLGDEIAVMRQGSIQQVGTAKAIFNQPKNEFVREFFDIERQQASLTVQDLLAADLGTVVNNQPQTITSSATLAELAQQLVDHPDGGVVATDGQEQRQLTMTDLTMLIAKRGL
ncbi:ABC transporter ATP-binding protein [Latilactobacillus curvatus]|uniref:ABC-type quaternary amine transporter n=1 Tax=Latilactobacillus curvatus JCM 1096 = DSM 20019 TaxID=1293592 RepID=A0AAJ0LF72_LATCU|nr:ABC transporter ATP-binding protein [Latilactobacillus curvatus]KRK92825.1 ABC transporter family protein [Latilactobacillus curvatus JCM 1096 = DSM 20019]MCT3530223.1 ABC transporter ATP-binding protein [Latilactobacillus curvatus]MDG2987973.1 ABC transporter ATP-binding protein [Latilactobacillus curvatus]QAS50223.1 ABC transporter ATP-binding protein [Latilactobacillus curvatus JCM 1096 = DSM 20019]GED81510.1 glycine/betaine ABC transporter ATP-binding protein [Latilactobacillus curvatus